MCYKIYIFVPPYKITKNPYSFIKMKKFIEKVLILFCLVYPQISYSMWMTDDLGDRFQKRYVQHDDDYSGAVRSTIIKLTDSLTISHKAVLYIHGFNDYFFQKEMAEEFIDHNYNFYAVDLRKYGRSIIKDQKKFQVRNLNEYFPDIDSALTVMREEGMDTIILMGHSTGGLISTYYLLNNPTAKIDALILNSPFFDWNLGNKEWLVPLISAIGSIFPNLKIPQGESVYGQTLDKNYHGEWEYNTNWKLHYNPYVDAGWIRAIDKAQKFIRKHPFEIKIPILLMYSSESYYQSGWSEEAQQSDAVLDVNDIKSIGRTLGHNITLAKVEGGMHDLFLSKEGVRTALYTYLFNWLSKNI